ncbi:Diphthamide biosynthesis protein 2 [Coemansia interrupta]|uniref:2-(3-amino-3-carboxypropyl)histidine synthase subunit 2 n=1 Tax=Coemansia interrupta TaxID=1126814 RepID=A0A9W8HC39_9FUNG|nr:Diphthamide biosynthesis protein 2 [Coemansia interrupta]
MAAIDNDGSGAIQREIEADHIRPKLSLDTARAVYEVDRTAQTIQQGGYQRVALQFPDTHLSNASTVTHLLQTQGVTAKLFVLADTSAGSCCVDEVAAAHYAADLVVHYGATCLSLTSRVPVLYVFGQEPVDLEDMAIKCRDEDGIKAEEGGSRHVLLAYDVGFAHCAQEAGSRLVEMGAAESVVVSQIDAAVRLYTPSKAPLDPSEPADPAACGQGAACCGGCAKPPGVRPAPSDDGSVRAGRTWTPAPGLQLSDYALVYIGDEGATLTNLLLTWRTHAAFSYNPQTRAWRSETQQTNRHLGRRYYAVQRARDADVIGLVVGTLAAARYLGVVQRLKEMLRAAEKKLYVFVVGKLSMAKLANFAEIQCFVLVACPENSLVDGKLFDRPVVTPYEMMLALARAREWSGDYVTDFRQFLDLSEDAAKDSGAPLEEGEDEEEAPHFSLVTGALKSRRRYAQAADAAVSSSGSDVAVRNNKTEIARYLGSAAAEHLLTRAFRGLGHDDDGDGDKDAELPQPMLAVEGRSGIARGYRTAEHQDDRI